MKVLHGGNKWDTVCASECRAPAVGGRGEAEAGGPRMFLGDYQHTLDAKGRVSLPAKFRDQMTGSLVVAKGFEDCLYVYPADAYQEFVESLTSKNDFDPSLRKVRRFFTSGAFETGLDKAGRVGLPQHLREYAGLEKDIAVTGNGNRIEIWDAKRWADYSGETDEGIEDFAKELRDAGLL
jgi:MraZ protein